jgi:hypothetical protein
VVPAVAVSRDAGRSWSVTELPAAGAGAWAQVSTVGTDTFATVVARRGGDPYPETLTIRAVHRSAAGRAFTPRGEVDGTVIGEVVPLVDGRLLAAGPHWYVTGPDAARFDRAGGSLPTVRRIARSPAGWIAYDLFELGWAALSSDGQTWRKLNIR